MLFDYDFNYECPYCHEKFIGEHDADNDTQKSVVICDECGKKFSLVSHVKIEITTTCEKIDDDKKDGKKDD